MFGRQLVRIASREALPYYEKLLTGDLKEDREMVLSGLAELVRRKHAPALALLIAAFPTPMDATGVVNSRLGTPHNLL